MATTTKHMRAVAERMRDAVENLGGDSMAANGRETSDLANLQNLNALAKALTNHGYFKGNVGGGGRSRTYDAADMSHADSDSNLLDLLTEILLEASAGDNRRG